MSKWSFRGPFLIGKVMQDLSMESVVEAGVGTGGQLDRRAVARGSGGQSQCDFGVPLVGSGTDVGGDAQLQGRSRIRKRRLEERSERTLQFVRNARALHCPFAIDR